MCTVTLYLLAVTHLIYKKFNNLRRCIICTFSLTLYLSYFFFLIVRWHFLSAPTILDFEFSAKFCIWNALARIFKTLTLLFFFTFLDSIWPHQTSNTSDKWLNYIWSNFQTPPPQFFFWIHLTLLEYLFWRFSNITPLEPFHLDIAHFSRGILGKK